MDPSQPHYPTSTSSDETEDDAHLYDHLTPNAAASASRKRSFDTLGRNRSAEMNILSSKGKGLQQQQQRGGGGARGSAGNMGGDTSTPSTTEQQQQQQQHEIQQLQSQQQPQQQQQQQQQRKYFGPSPLLRKEQNRAAQRAFRDRKERYVHQLEGMIKEQKEQHLKVTSRFQTNVALLTERNAVLQSENHYLREVIFAFETALSKGAALGVDAGIAGLHRAMLQSVKEELFKRHHAKKAEIAAAEAAKKSAPASMPTPRSEDGTAMDESSTSPSITVTASDKTENPIVINVGVDGGEEQSISSQKRAIEDLQGPCSPPAIKARRSNSTASSSSVGDYGGGASQQAQRQEQRPSQLHPPSSEHPTEDVITGPTSGVLYKAPPLFLGPGADHGTAMLISSPFESITVPSLLATKSSYPNVTRYPNYPTVFDELQSSLFPPGTLRSLVHESMPTPREVIEDNSLFDQQPRSFSKKQRFPPGRRNPQQGKGVGQKPVVM